MIDDAECRKTGNTGVDLHTFGLVGAASPSAVSVVDVFVFFVFFAFFSAAGVSAASAALALFVFVVILTSAFTGASAEALTGSSVTYTGFVLDSRAGESVLPSIASSHFHGWHLLLFFPGTRVYAGKGGEEREDFDGGSARLTFFLLAFLSFFSVMMTERARDMAQLCMTASVCGRCFRVPKQFEVFQQMYLSFGRAKPRKIENAAHTFDWPSLDTDLISNGCKHEYTVVQRIPASSHANTLPLVVNVPLF